MALEIERKFLVNKKIWQAYTQSVSLTGEDIEQGYLSKSSKHTIRIRLTGSSATLTIKGKRKGITRDEFEYDIPYDEGVSLYTLCDSVVSKTRYRLYVGSKLWEVDQFYGLNQGLLLAEIELKSEDEQFELPVWVTDEVSQDKRYTNSYVATHKVPTK